MTIAAIIATPKPSMTNDEPITLCVIISVIAFITNRKNPSDKMVIGNVKMTSMGLRNVLRIDKIKLASIAVPKLSIWNESNIWATAINATAFSTMDKNQRSNINAPHLRLGLLLQLLNTTDQL